MELAPGARLDRYIVECLIGEGGMAAVYRARHVHLGTTVALKVLAIPMAAVQQRLLLEGRAQAALRHPNIVAVTDVIDVYGSPGLVMELVEGPSLADLLEERRLTLAQADELARGILEGVAAAHRLGIVHRDLKPGNVLLELRPTGVVPKVTDFGLAKAIAGYHAMNTSDSHDGSPVGTPAFMAPEQLRDPKSVDARADVFALGALLYEMVVGRRAFAGEHVMEIYTAIHAGRYTPPEEIRPDLPPRMARAIRGALVVDREQRIPSVEALREVWIGGDEVQGAGVSGVRWGEVILEARRLAARPVRGRGGSSGEGRQASPPSELVTQPGPVAVLRAAPVERRWLERARPRSPMGYAVATAVLAAVVVIAAVWNAAVTPRAGEAPETHAAPAAPAPVAGTEAAPPPVVVPTDAAPTDAAPGQDAAAADAPPAPPTDAALTQADPTPLPAVDAAPAAPRRPAPAALPAPVVPVPAPAAAPVAEPTPAEAPAGPPAAGPTAVLIVNSKPWSDRIVVDGATPIALKDRVHLPPGPHTLTLRAHDGRSVSRTVELAADRTLVFCWDFDADAPCGG